MSTPLRLVLKSNLDTRFREALDRWSRKTPEARAYLAAVEDALDRLGTKPGERAEACREFLTVERTRISGPLATIDAYGIKLDGSAAVDLIARLVAQSTAHADARRVFDLAKPADVKKARDSLDVVEAEGRELEREVAAIETAIRFPYPLPDPAETYGLARSMTSNLVNAAKIKSQPARALELAFQQAHAPADVAKLFPAYEPAGADTDKTSPIYWRAQRRAEGV
jgi:hypothetical protein